MLHATAWSLSPQGSDAQDQDLFGSRSCPLKGRLCSKSFQSSAIVRFKLQGERLNLNAWMPDCFRLYSTSMTMCQIERCLNLQFPYQSHWNGIAKPTLKLLDVCSVPESRESCCGWLRYNLTWGQLKYSHLKSSAMSSVKAWSYGEKNREKV